MSNKKTLYHSELVKRSPVDLTVKSDAIESQYPDRNPYIEVFDHEEGCERRYETENDECSESLAAWKGYRVMAHAAGRKEEGRIECDQVNDEDAPPKPTTRPAARPATRPAATPTARRQESGNIATPTTRTAAREAAPKLTKAEREEAQVEALRKAYKLGLKASVLMEALTPLAHKVCMGIASATGTQFANEDLRAVLVSLFIEVKGYTDVSALPSKLPAPATAATQQPPAPEPEPEPEPLPPPAEEEAEELDFIPF